MFRKKYIREVDVDYIVNIGWTEGLLQPSVFHTASRMRRILSPSITARVYSGGMAENPQKKQRSTVPKEDRKATFERRRDVMQMFSDNAKTYVQLSGAALALTLTFAKQILHIPDTQSIVSCWTISMWLCFLLAILLGALSVPRGQAA